jgi:hypothetical protein
MRTPILPLLLLSAVPAAADAKPNRALLPFEGRYGFGPEAPRALPADHPLYGRVILETAAAGVHGQNAGAKSREWDEALRSTLASGNMLARDPADARVRLTVRWRSLDVPFRIGISSRATMAALYELRRIDTGQVIFSREIVTQVQARGGNAATRAKGTGHAAVAANLASAFLCMDKAAFGHAPANCALSPTGSFPAPIAVVTPVYRR